MTDQSSSSAKSSSTTSLKLNLYPSSQPVDPETAVRCATGIRTSTAACIRTEPTSASLAVLLACVLPRTSTSTAAPALTRMCPTSASAARTHHFGGILESPVVLLCAGTSMPLSPPPMIPMPTHALLPAEPCPGLSLELIQKQEQDFHMDADKTPLGFAPSQPRGFTPLGFAPHPQDASPFSSPRELDNLELDLYSDPGTDSDMSDLDLGGAYGAPSPLRSFASLPSPDLDNLELNMELTPAPSSSRRSATPLPPSPFPSTFPSSTAEHTADPPPALAPNRANALLLDLPPAPPVTALPPSPLNVLGPAALAMLLVLRVRTVAAPTLALATASTSAAGAIGRGTLEYELRWSVPRDAGKPRRRRKRAKEVGREVEALREKGGGGGEAM
ncbi:hypothetical protein FB451DRAFT_1571989 [Mycena latifolia]|nr:hypothetical protein FB451DRAFT_1571989 [Mycena latifolia]